MRTHGNENMLQSMVDSTDRSYLRSPSLIFTDRNFAISALLHVSFYISLIRATSMWFAYPPGQEDQGSIDPIPQKLILYSLIPLLLTYIVINKEHVFINIASTSMRFLGIITLLIVSVLLSQDFAASFRAFAAVSLLCTPPILFRWRYGGERTHAVIASFCAFSVVINLIYSVIFPQYGIMGGALAGSMRGLFIHKNIFGQFCAISMIFLFPNRWDRGVKLIIRLITCILCLVCVYFSHSSTGLILIVIGPLTLIVIHSIRRMPTDFLRIYMFIMASAALILLSYLLIFILLPFATSLLNKDPTLSGRTLLWSLLMQLATEKPWFGHGFGIFRQPDVMAVYSADFGWDARSTHNTYIELFLNIGFPLTIFVLFMFLERLCQRIVGRETLGTPDWLRVRDATVIVTIMLGAMTEAGAMLAPLIQWPLLIAVSCNSRWPLKYK